MRSTSSPLKIVATSIGKSLLSWYCILEDYYAFSTTSRGLLPKAWRKKRRYPSQMTDTRLGRSIQCSDENNKARVLDDLWQEYRAMVPELIDVIAELKILPSLDPVEKATSQNRLLAQLRIFQRNFSIFTESSELLNALQFTIMETPPSDWHAAPAYGGPPPPFQPYQFDYPPAGLLSLVCNCVEVLVRGVYLPILSSSLSPPNDPQQAKLEKDITECYAYELCQAYAGLEISFQNNQDELIPCFSPLFSTAFCCPPGLRTWLWHKLAHYEQFFPTTVSHARKLLAGMWKLPELDSGGFEAWKEKPPELRTDEGYHPEDIEFVSKLANLKLPE
jgi:hypothetical protein